MTATMGGSVVEFSSASGSSGAACPVRVISSCPHSPVNPALDVGCFSRKRMVLWVRLFVSAKKNLPPPLPKGLTAKGCLPGAAPADGEISSSFLGGGGGGSGQHGTGFCC